MVLHVLGKLSELLVNLFYVLLSTNYTTGRMLAYDSTIRIRRIENNAEAEC